MDVRDVTHEPRGADLDPHRGWPIWQIVLLSLSATVGGGAMAIVFFEAVFTSLMGATACGAPRRSCAGDAPNLLEVVMVPTLVYAVSLTIASATANSARIRWIFALACAAMVIGPVVLLLQR